MSLKRTYNHSPVRITTDFCKTLISFETETANCFSSAPPQRPRRQLSLAPSPSPGLSARLAAQSASETMNGFDFSENEDDFDKGEGTSSGSSYRNLPGAKPLTIASLLANRVVFVLAQKTTAKEEIPYEAINQVKPPPTVCSIVSSVIPANLTTLRYFFSSSRHFPRQKQRNLSSRRPQRLLHPRTAFSRRSTPP